MEGLDRRFLLRHSVGMTSNTAYVITRNLPGYLPEGDNLPVFDSFEEAKQALIALLLAEADAAAAGGRPSLADSLSVAAEDANLANAPQSYWARDYDDPNAPWEVYEIMEVR